ncbi:magnesium transporter [Microbacterium album]|uniref:Magnesium transporter MgtE n=1 Tax=Microbacterium album TaxID=2053191 RepID=A0A917IER7_9MICO|nr:magnesium transporter [Microbacterium album]GGH39185.1 magnesium transporter MgtE [Microbacterium album]
MSAAPRPEPSADLRQLIEQRRYDEAADWMLRHPRHVVADEIARMPAVEAAAAFRLLDKEQELEVFEELDAPQQQRILEGLRAAEFRSLVEQLDPDDRVRMLHEAPAKVVRRVLADLSPTERIRTTQLLGYPDGSVGRFMTPEVIALREHLTLSQALDVVRRQGETAESVYTLAVVDGSRHLRGTVGLDDLVLGGPDALVADVMDADPPVVQATDSAEQAARLMRDTNEVNLFVVDSERRLLGLFSFDDAVEVLEEADSDDVARQAGSQRWEGHYMAVGVWRLSRYRALWLSLLLVAATLTVTVTQVFEHTLAQVAQLALFIPMLVGAGGNAGAQAATACVRALALGEVRVSDVWRVVWRETRVGFILGALLAALGVLVSLLFVDLRIAVVVGLSLVLICTWAATIGGTMPLLARKLGIDPAMVSAPLVTTLVDATGLMIYFLIAQAVLGL